MSKLPKDPHRDQWWHCSVRLLIFEPGHRINIKHQFHWLVMLITCHSNLNASADYDWFVINQLQIRSIHHTSGHPDTWRIWSMNIEEAIPNLGQKLALLHYYHFQPWANGFGSNCSKNPCCSSAHYDQHGIRGAICHNPCISWEKQRKSTKLAVRNKQTASSKLISTTTTCNSSGKFNSSDTHLTLHECARISTLGLAMDHRIPVAESDRWRVQHSGIQSNHPDTPSSWPKQTLIPTTHAARGPVTHSSQGETQGGDLRFGSSMPTQGLQFHREANSHRPKMFPTHHEPSSSPFTMRGSRSKNPNFSFCIHAEWTPVLDGILHPPLHGHWFLVESWISHYL